MAGAVEYIDCISAVWVRSPPPTSVLNMTLKCEMLSTYSLQLLPSLLWSGVEASNRFLSMSQIKLLDIRTVCKQITHAKLNC